jgi:spore maturation protein CgeB
MRILVTHPGPDFSVADVYNGWLEALQATGHQVAGFTLNDRLNFYDQCLIQDGDLDENGGQKLKRAFSHEQAITMAQAGLPEALYKFWPHVVLVISGHFVSANSLDVMRDRGHTVVLLHTESPYEDTRQIELSAHADIALVNDPANLDGFRRACPRSYYMPHAYRPGLHRPGPPDPRLKCDLAFAGTGFQSRIDFFEAMDLDGIDVALAGCWLPMKDDSPLAPMLVHDKDECLDNDQVVDLYRSARAGINLYRRESDEGRADEGTAVGPREIEMAATGLFFLRDPRPEGDALFPMLPVFDGPGDASEKLRWWLARDGQRAEAARQARAAVAGRTFERNARELLRHLESMPVNGRVRA